MLHEGRAKQTNKLNSPPTFSALPKLSRGDSVAILSPSWGGPGHFPAVYELGIKQFESTFGLKAIEYPTTRSRNASPSERARDLMSAFSNPEHKAIIASIRGDDQVKVLPHLDPSIIKANPKPFFGYSDNTNLSLYLWNLGIPSYYGGSVMVQFAMVNGIHDLTRRQMETAVFKRGEIELVASDFFTDHDIGWDTAAAITTPREMESSKGWIWSGQQSGQGTLWGGCLEIIDWHLKLGRHIPIPAGLGDAVICLETSEELPAASIVYRCIMSLGELGLLERCQGLLMARPKSRFRDSLIDTKARNLYRMEQLAAVERAFREYNSNAPIIQNMDFGHTDPQLILPVGRKVRIDTKAQRIFAEY
jgi:muramoyltetrapeptide carboxypeptidase LdcA involved in peptidoglycan recycling